MVAMVAYTRETHFCEHLERMQGIENTDIPIKVIEIVRSQLKQRNIDPNPTVIFDILKVSKHYNYYNHIIKIINTITEQSCVDKLIEEEHKLILLLFEQCSNAHDNIHKSLNIHGFLSYKYVLIKLCTMCDKFKRFLPFLKCVHMIQKEKYDIIWNKICQYNIDKGLEYWQLNTGN